MRIKLTGEANVHIEETSWQLYETVLQSALEISALLRRRAAATFDAFPSSCLSLLSLPRPNVHSHITHGRASLSHHIHTAHLKDQEIIYPDIFNISMSLEKHDHRLR